MTVILKDIKLAHCLTPHSVVGKKNVDPLVVEVQRLKKEIEILKIDHAAEIKKLEENLLHEKENIAHGKENIARFLVARTLLWTPSRQESPESASERKRNNLSSYASLV